MNDLAAIDVAAEQQNWKSYTPARSRVEDMYPSERFFLTRVLPHVDSMLDIGCGSGGFSTIARAINSGVAYTGVDITPELVDIAKSEHVEHRFEVSDGISLPFDDGEFDLVFSSGVLDLNSRYREVIASAYRVSRHWLLFDVRLSDHARVGRMRLPSGDALPYVVLREADLRQFLEDLDPIPRRVIARGYPITPSSGADVGAGISAAFFLVERGPGELEWDTRLDGVDEHEEIVL